MYSHGNETENRAAQNNLPPVNIAKAAPQTGRYRAQNAHRCYDGLER